MAMGTWTSEVRNSNDDDTITDDDVGDGSGRAWAMDMKPGKLCSALSCLMMTIVTCRHWWSWDWMPLALKMIVAPAVC